jgi:uncharacterized protein YeaO (DUF488 family)
LIKIAKSLYGKRDLSDGERILVMRIWPRGISKDKIDVWMKDLGTERELIKKWKGGKIVWNDFAREYRKSLKGKEDLLKQLAEKSEKGNITLLCTDRDPARCHRSLLAKEIEKFVKRRAS